MVTAMVIHGDFGTYEVIFKRRDLADASILIQSDWDYPVWADNFGARIRNPRCPDLCRSTDGTVKCDTCGKGPGYYIDKAQDYLDRHVDEWHLIPEEYAEQAD